MLLFADEEFVRATQAVLRTHAKYRKRAHRESPGGRAATAVLNTATSGVIAVDAADELTDRVRARQNDLRLVLPESVSRREFRQSRAQIELAWPKSCATWQLRKLRCATSGASIARVVDLANCVHVASEEFRAVVDMTAGHPKRLKDRERDAARDRLAALLQGLNSAMLASANAASQSDHARVALVGLARP